MNEFKKLIMMANNHAESVDESKYPPYLCFQALESGFQTMLKESDCQYSLDCINWIDLPANTLTKPIGLLDKIYFKANLTPKQEESNGLTRIGNFQSSKKYRLSGSPTSLLHGDDCSTNKSVPSYGLAYLFANDKVVSISVNFLDFSELGSSGCRSIFESCKNLVGDVSIYKASKDGYTRSFYGTSIDAVNIYTAESDWNIFQEMLCFTSIKNLTLPATYLYPIMYNSIAVSCELLEKAVIRAIKIATNEATTYSEHLKNAFYGCRNLSEVISCIIAAPSKKYNDNWLTDVAEEGTLILNKLIAWDPEMYRNGDIDNIEGSATFGETITWGIPSQWHIKYCDANTLEVKDSKADFIEDGDYMTLSYIQTDGNQYIDSQINLDDECVVEVDTWPSSNQTGYVLLGNSYDANNRVTLTPGNISNISSRFNGALYTGNLYRNKRSVYRLDKTGIYIDNKLVAYWNKTPSPFNHETSFFIFSDRNTSGNASTLAKSGSRIYRVKVSKNGNTIADIVPKFSISLNKPGLYDNINKRFLINIGTGEFTYR